MMRIIAEIVVSPLVWKIPMGIMAIACVIVIAYWIYSGITLNMARNRHRDPLGWVLLSLFVSPVLTWIILLIVGDKDDNKKHVSGESPDIKFRSVSRSKSRH